MPDTDLGEAARFILRESHLACDHLWNAHQQCQWCHRDRRDVHADELASAYLGNLDMPDIDRTAMLLDALARHSTVSITVDRDVTILEQKRFNDAQNSYRLTEIGRGADVQAAAEAAAKWLVQLKGGEACGATN